MTPKFSSARPVPRTTVVWGSSATTAGMPVCIEMYRSIPTSALWVVPNGGHGPIFGPLAAPFAGTALAFLRGE